MPGRASQRGSSGRRQSLAAMQAVPATPGTTVPATPGTAVDVQSPRVSRKVSSFYGSGMPRPGLLADPEQAATQVVKSQRGRVEFVSPVQALMEWAVATPAKDGGVAPQWVGKPPRKPLTQERAFLEDRRAALVADKPDLKLLTYSEQVRLATRDGARNFDDLSFEQQEKYRQYAAADERRYAAQCEVFEKANPGWRAFQARRAAAKAARVAARTPPAPPPTAEELYIEAWLTKQEPEAAGAGGEALEQAAEAAAAAWEEASNGERAPFEAQAAAALKRSEEKLAEWKQQRAAAAAERKQRKARFAQAAAAPDEQQEAPDSSDSDAESSDDDGEAAAAAEFEAATAGQGARKATRSGGKGATSAAATQKTGGSGKGQAAAAAGGKGGGKGASAAQGGDAKAAAARRQAPTDPGLQSPTGKRRPGGQTPKGPATPPKRAKTAAVPNRAETEAQAIAMAEARAIANHKEFGNRPGAFPQRPAKLVGAPVANTFATDGGEVVFAGRVTEYLFARITGQGVTPLWAVEYEDGDSGEAEWFELKELLTVWPPPGL